MSMFNTFFEFLVPLFANTAKTEYDIQALSKATGIHADILQDCNQYSIDVDLMEVNAQSGSSSQYKKAKIVHLLHLTNRKTGMKQMFVGKKDNNDIVYTEATSLPVSAPLWHYTT